MWKLWTEGLTPQYIPWKYVDLLVDLVKDSFIIAETKHFFQNGSLSCPFIFDTILLLSLPRLSLFCSQFKIFENYFYIFYSQNLCALCNSYIPATCFSWGKSMETEFQLWISNRFIYRDDTYSPFLSSYWLSYYHLSSVTHFQVK